MRCTNSSNIQIFYYSIRCKILWDTKRYSKHVEARELWPCTVGRDNNLQYYNYSSKSRVFKLGYTFRLPIFAIDNQIDKHKHKPHITKVYTRKYPRGANHPTVTTHPKGVNHPIVTIHPKGARSKDVNQGDMTLANSQNQPKGDITLANNHNQPKDVNQGDMTLGNSHNQLLWFA